MTIGALLVSAAASVVFVRQVGVSGGTNAPTAQGQAAEEITPERPNVLIIMTDDQNTSSDGYAVMDDTMRLFREGGTYYKNAVATTPRCAAHPGHLYSRGATLTTPESPLKIRQLLMQRRPCNAS